VGYSQTFNFGQNTLVETFVRDAFELCGIPGSDISGLQSDSALLSLNFLLSNWANKGLNLFTEQKAMIQLKVGQPNYLLNSYTIKVTEVTASNNTILSGGVAFSSAGGTASNAFNGTPSSSNPCTQTSPNGYISYTYPTGNTPAVYYVGIQSNVSIDYNLVVEYSYDGNVWMNYLTIGSTYYPVGQIIWAAINSPLNIQAIRIRETGGATLNIQQIYLAMPSFSRILTPISREEWISYPNKQIQATPSSFYLDRQITPKLNLWPTPDNSYQTLVFNQQIAIMDVTSLNQNIFIPQRFMNACRFGLAYEMALKFALDKADRLERLSVDAYTWAAIEDEEKVPVRIQPNMYSYT
jgi:hypothetical protein